MLTNYRFRIKFSRTIRKAEVAELADALGSGLSGRKVVRVQVPPSAFDTRGNAGIIYSHSI